MPKTLKDLIAEAEKRGFAVGDPIRLSDAESELVGNAYYLDPSQTLRHFMKFEYFVALLQNRGLRFRPLNRFDDDPDEGTLSATNATGSSNAGRQLTEQWGTNPETEGWKQFINATQRTLVYVHCWFGHDAEDKEMWSRYGDAGKGVCLTTTVRRLTESLSGPLTHRPQLGKVTYLDDDVPIPTIISSLAVFRKRPRFAHEKEFRLVRELSFEECPKGANGCLMPPDHHIASIDLDKLLGSVIVGPNNDPAFFQKVEDVVKMAGLSRVVRKSGLNSWETHFSRKP